MAIRINYNPMSVLTHANLAKTDRLMSGVLDRMSSGQRLRRSADDPASMVVANSVRYYRTGVDRAQSNAEEGVTMLQTAEGGMDQITQILQRIRNLAISAKSTATTDPEQAAALQADLEAGIRSITTITAGTTYGSNPLLDGSLRDITLSDEAKDYYRVLRPDYTKLPAGMRDGAALAIDPPGGTLAKPSTVHAFGAGTPSTAVASATAGTMAITGPKGSTTLNIPAGASIDAVVAAINASRSLTGVAAAYDATTGDLHVESMSYGNSTLSVATAGLGGLLSGAVTPATNRTIDLDYVDSTGTTRTVTLTQDPASTDGLTFTNLAGGPEAVAPFTAFAPGAFSLTVKDTSTGAVGSTISPAGITVSASRVGTTAFQIGALSSQRVTVEIPDLRAGALGNSAGLAGTGFASLDDLLTRTGPPAYAGAFLAGDADQALSLIDAALNEVNRARGATGSLQGNTVERVMESLRVSSVNLREFEGILRDVDMAEESAEYARVQVMIQAATAMLAQANQVPQTVLQLLK
jgi:flagellin